MSLLYFRGTRHASFFSHLTVLSLVSDIYVFQCDTYDFSRLEVKGSIIDNFITCVQKLSSKSLRSVLRTDAHLRLDTLENKTKQNNKINLEIFAVDIISLNFSKL